MHAHYAVCVSVKINVDISSVTGFSGNVTVLAQGGNERSGLVVPAVSKIAEG